MRETENNKGAAPPSAWMIEEAEELGLRIRQARRSLGLDQKDVAFAAHVSPRTVFAIEKGKPTVRLDVLARVMATVGLSLDIRSRDVVWPRPSKGA